MSATAPNVEVMTFGCRLNAYESEVMRAHATEAGLADALVFNTCAVTKEAVRQAEQAIADGADTLLSVGGVQSNSARVVAAGPGTPASAPVVEGGTADDGREDPREDEDDDARDIVPAIAADEPEG